MTAPAAGRRGTAGTARASRAKPGVGTLLAGCLLILLALWTASATAQTRSNVAAAANGGVASASSTYNAHYPVGAIINGDRKGQDWGISGGWNDETYQSYPDWVQVDFSGPQTISEIDLYMVQDDYANPVTPTAALQCTLYCMTAFRVQYWTGSVWADVSGGNIAANNKVWRQLTFAPLVTSRIRVLSSAAQGNYSRLVELEAWSATGPTDNAAPGVALTAPLTGSTATLPPQLVLTASATDSDGSIARVEFFRDTTLIATVTSGQAGVYSAADANAPAGYHSYTARAYDNGGAVSTSVPALVRVMPAGSTEVNVASAARGGVASASSSYNAHFPVSALINGDRKGVNWGAGGGWNDATYNTYPDWVQVRFSGPQTIAEIDLFTLQDTPSTPVDPTPTLTFTSAGATDYQVQFWTGGAWADVPGGVITDSNLVWQRLAFAPIVTDRIQVRVNYAFNGFTRLTEIEAWADYGPSGAPLPTVTLTAPADGTTVTAPAAVSLTANATVSGGSIARVEFTRNGTLAGTVTSGSAGNYSFSDSGLAPDYYLYTATAYDSNGGVVSSTPVGVTVLAAGSGALVNVAASANGGVASASSTYAAGYPASGANNGERKGLNWGSGGGWSDATAGVYPDWLQITFNGLKSINRIDLFSVQDNPGAPLTPTPTLTFNNYGLTDFQVQFWNGGSWVDVPGGAVTANNLVWRQFNFTPLTTDRIRVLVNGAFGNYARIAELEAWGTAASGGAGGGGGGATPAAGIYFIEADHLETPRLISNAQQQVVWRWDQAEPFGDTPPNDNPSNLGTFEFNLRFPGQYRDKETNLNYNFFRDYDPGLGRYLQSDPIGLRGGLNTYLYVKANPLSGVDPLGLEPGTLAQRGYPAADPSPSAGSLFGLTTAVSSFWRNYQDMRQANTIGADKYFHCMANCQASKGGLLGLAAAQCMSDGREWFDQNVKGDPPWASEQDQGANRQGQLQGFFRQDRCQIICDNLRPPGLSPTY